MWTYPQWDLHYAALLPMYYRVPQTVLQDLVCNPASIWPWRSLCLASSKSHQHSAPGGCGRSWAGAQPVHTGSETRQPPSNSQPEKVLTYCTWLKECETLLSHSSSLSSLLSYHNPPITYNHSDLKEMNSPPQGLKWSVCPLRASFRPCCLIQLGTELEVSKSIFPRWLNRG